MLEYGSKATSVITTAVGNLSFINLIARGTIPNNIYENRNRNRNRNKNRVYDLDKIINKRMEILVIK
jgi:hypothetical protein